MFLRNPTDEILFGVKPGSSINVPDAHADRINDFIEAGFEELGEAFYSSLEDFDPRICFRALKEIIRRYYDGDVDAMTIVDMKLKYIELGITDRIPLITDNGEDCQGFQDSYETSKEEREEQSTS